MATVEKQPRSATGNGVGELLDRQPPRSIEAERAVIGSLLLLPEACDEVALIVRPDDERHFIACLGQKQQAADDGPFGLDAARRLAIEQLADAIAV